MTLTLPDDVLYRLINARRVVALTGGGVAAESGIPSFREAHTGHWARTMSANWRRRRRSSAIRVSSGSGMRTGACWRSAPNRARRTTRSLIWSSTIRHLP